MIFHKLLLFIKDIRVLYSTRCLHNKKSRNEIKEIPLKGTLDIISIKYQNVSNRKFLCNIF